MRSKIFFTEFPVSSKNSIDYLIKTGMEWIEGSPYTAIPDGALPKSFESDEWFGKFGSENISLCRVIDGDSELAGFKYARTEDSGLTWETTVVGEKRNGSFWVGVQTACETNILAAKTFVPKKPYLIKKIIENGDGGKDGLLDVKDQPHELRNSDVELASKLLQGVGGTVLPVVYVSAPFFSKIKLDVKPLALWLSGMAHVVVEPNRAFSIKLMDVVNNINVYGGAIGIYWPDGSGMKRYLKEKVFSATDDVFRIIYDEVRNALASKRPFGKCTWSNVADALARNKLEKLKADGSMELDKYISAFDEELAAKKDLLENANNEVLRLSAFLRQYELMGVEGASDGILKLGKEQDLYPGECVELLLSVLNDVKGGLLDKSRRLHVVLDVLEANKSCGNIRAKEATLKSLLRSYTNMDAKTKSGLEALGFDISSEGKHYKLVFRGDPRYTFILSKTSSDHRAGKNSASEISKILF